MLECHLFVAFCAFSVVQRCISGDPGGSRSNPSVRRWEVVSRRPWAFGTGFARGLDVNSINLVTKSFSGSFIINVKCGLVLISDIPHLQYTFLDVGDEPPDPIIGRGSEIIGAISRVQAMLC